MGVRDSSPRSCSAGVLAIATAKRWAPVVALVIVTGTGLAATVSLAAAPVALPPVQAAGTAIAAATNATMIREVMLSNLLLRLVRPRPRAVPCRRRQRAREATDPARCR